ncbi:ParA family protein [Methylocystis sp. B8]|uniref:ParA family protein n=1 Tax=Methylocystis sp. B8 TaxID=544938 RepID=UPI0010FDFF6B|nr:ParA family protein [Methylocystis sp. B8]TLG71887.1 ParA family protein [Methylocystis sp. B8]
MKVIVVNNEKGGVGKSTIAVHLAWYFAEHRKRVLFLDLDPQSNATTTLSAQIGGPEAAAFFARPVAVPPLSAPGIRVAPATPALRGILTVDGKLIQQFCSNLRDISGCHYDIAVIDTPPTFGVRNLTALVAGNFVLAPIDLDDYAIDGIETLLKHIVGVKQKYNPNLNFLGLIPNRLQTTSPRQRDNLKSLIQKFGTRYLFDGVIPQRSSIGEALAEKKPVWSLPKTAARDAGREMRMVFDKLAAKMDLA